VTTPSRAWPIRLLLFLYSNGNIVGSALALLGPALLFGGIVRDGWLLITTGLYAAGYLLAGRPRAVERRIEESLTQEEMVRRLDTLIAGARPHLSEELQPHLESLRASIVEVLPKLAGSDHPELFTVKETVLRYLPETIANYLELPPMFRNTRVLKDGKTARALLAEQLALLDESMRDVDANDAASDAQALVANGKFLEQRFRQTDFLAG
jgi:septum formation topological specificity factor MinE